MSVLTASKPIFTYFDLYGRGEAVRMALTHSKTDFEVGAASTWDTANGCTGLVAALCFY